MSDRGIQEFLRLYEDGPARWLPRLPAVHVTDDLSGVMTTDGRTGATAQVGQMESDGRVRVRISPDAIPGMTIVGHETGHIVQLLVQTRLGPVYPMLDVFGDMVRATLALRGAAPGPLAGEQMASMLPEAFIGEWGGYEHPLYGTDPNTVRDRVAAWYATPAAAAMRRWWAGLPELWSPPVETRIASFWQLVNTLPAEAVLTARDLGAWAQNVIDRDPSAAILAGDFRRDTEQMQRSLDRAAAA